MSNSTSLEHIIQTLNREAESKGVPACAFHIEPIAFSGNFTGKHSQRNPPFYGFTLACLDPTHADTLTTMFSKLKYSNLQPISRATGRLAITGTPKYAGFLVGYGAEDIVTLSEAINTLVLSHENGVPVDKASRPVRKF